MSYGQRQSVAPDEYPRSADGRQSPHGCYEFGVSDALAMAHSQVVRGPAYLTLPSVEAKNFLRQIRASC